MRTRTMRFRFVNGAGRALEACRLRVELVESRTLVHHVRCDRDEIRWIDPTTPPPAAAQAPAPPMPAATRPSTTSTANFLLDVPKRVRNLRSFAVEVEYSGGPPVVGTIRKEGVPGVAPIATTPAEEPATRITRRKAAVGRLLPSLREHYRWFTLLEERSDEDVLAAAAKAKVPLPGAGAKATIGTTPGVAEFVTELRGALQTSLEARMGGARIGAEVDVCTPKIDPMIAARVLIVHDAIFVAGVRSSGVGNGTGKGAKSLAALANQVTDAFLSFCQGDLRVDDAVSDVNVEPDSAMMFLFAEYALVLLQVVDEYGRPGAATNAMKTEQQDIARRLFADARVVAIWKRLAASFVLGQRSYMRTYAPRRRLGPPHFEDYVRTNFDHSEKLDAAEIAALRAPYDALAFRDDVRPMSDPSVRNLCWRQALNACEAFPGMLEADRGEQLGPLALKQAGSPPPTATVYLRDVRGAGPSLRRHVRHEVASVAPRSRGIASTDTMQQIGIGPKRRALLKAMLVAFVSTRTKGVVAPSALSIGAAATIDSIALQLTDLLP